MERTLYIKLRHLRGVVLGRLLGQEKKICMRYPFHHFWLDIVLWHVTGSHDSNVPF